jgi:threonine synthase
MDVGDPSNFERMLWLYGGSVDAMRQDIVGSRHEDDEVKRTIRRVYDERGYLMDPHSAIAYLGLKGQLSQAGRGGGEGQVGIFLATAHPAKFGEIVEPVIGRAIDMPGPLTDALSRPPQILRMRASLDRVAEALRG